MLSRECAGSLNSHHALEALCGSWSTALSTPGEGICPSGSPVRFHEILSISRLSPSDSWLQLSQRATSADSGETLHAEHGFLRLRDLDRGQANPRAPDKHDLELSLAMNSGRLEYARGELVIAEGISRLTLTSEAFLNDRLRVITMRRTLTFDAAGNCDKLLELACSRPSPSAALGACPLELATGLGWPTPTRHMWSRLLRVTTSE